MRLIPPERRSRDREYKADEIREDAFRGFTTPGGSNSLHGLIGTRVGAFEYLNVGHVKPIEKNGKLLCGGVLAYAGEGDDEYETLISRGRLT
jgi:hypothetical protein